MLCSEKRVGKSAMYKHIREKHAEDLELEKKVVNSMESDQNNIIKRSTRSQGLLESDENSKDTMRLI